MAIHTLDLEYYFAIKKKELVLNQFIWKNFHNVLDKKVRCKELCIMCYEQWTQISKTMYGYGALGGEHGSFLLLIDTFQILGVIRYRREMREQRDC